MTGNQAYFPPERPEPDVCLTCGQESWCCLCMPEAENGHQRVSYSGPTAAELERARESRLTRGERLSSVSDVR